MVKSPVHETGNAAVLNHYRRLEQKMEIVNIIADLRKQIKAATKTVLRDDLKVRRGGREGQGGNHHVHLVPDAHGIGNRATSSHTTTQGTRGSTQGTRGSTQGTRGSTQGTALLQGTKVPERTKPLADRMTFLAP